MANGVHPDQMAEPSDLNLHFLESWDISGPSRIRFNSVQSVDPHQLAPSELSDLTATVVKVLKT